jgi:hypothetical protein
MEHRQLRPIERRMMRLADAGVPVDEIARRFRRRPDSVEQVVRLARLPGRAARDGEGSGHLRPLERCILGWRARGFSHAEIAPRFHRSADFVARVEALANYKLAPR